MTRRRLLLTAAAAALAVAGAVVAGAGAAAALEHFRAGRWTEARAALQEPGDGPGGGQDLLLQAYLARRPEAALASLEATLGGPAPLVAAARIDAAALRLAQGRHRDALTLLEPLVGAGGDTPPGRALLLAGLARRALGDRAGAEAMLATVKPADPSFAAARTALGDIALAERDAAKALRYYESAGNEARAGGGRWLALRLSGRDEDAERVRSRLTRDAPGGVALLEIGRHRRAEDEETAARLAQTQPGTGAHGDADGAPAAGRYTLQLGAYSDRGLALEMVGRHRGQVPDLRIDTVRDDRGQLLHKVRSGSFVNPALAQAEAERLQRALGIEVFVAETAD